MESKIKISKEAINGQGRGEGRISKGLLRSMVLVAILFDILSLIPLVNIIVSIFAWMTFSFWFWIHGVKYTSNAKNLFYLATGLIIEALPFASILPAITVAVWRIAKSAQLEDGGGSLISKFQT